MITEEVIRRSRPVAGKCVIELERPVTIGSIVIPDSAQGPRMYTDQEHVRQSDVCYIGKVLAMTPRNEPAWFDEGFVVGDRVAVMLLMEDVEKKVILTQNNRVRAVLT